MQRGDGIAGAMIVKPKEPVIGVKDLPEHTLVIQDWFNRSAANKGFVHLHDNGTNWPDSIIVNGNVCAAVCGSCDTLLLTPQCCVDNREQPLQQI